VGCPQLRKFLLVQVVVLHDQETKRFQTIALDSSDEISDESGIVMKRKALSRIGRCPKVRNQVARLVASRHNHSGNRDAQFPITPSRRLYATSHCSRLRACSM